MGRKRVEHLMRENGTRGRQKRRFRRATNSNHSLAIAPNVLQRRFAQSASNTAWVTDVTYIATGESCSYLAALLDLFSRRVVGWAMSARGDCWDNALAESFFATLRASSWTTNQIRQICGVVTQSTRSGRITRERAFLAAEELALQQGIGNDPAARSSYQVNHLSTLRSLSPAETAA